MRTHTWNARWTLTLSACGILIGAGIVWLFISKADKASSGMRVTDPDYKPMTARQEREMEGVATRDRLVRRIAASSRIGIKRTEPWIDEAGDRLLGAVVHIELSPSVDMRRARVPVYITPGPSARRGTPTLERVGVISATGVAGLNASVLLRSERVVTLEPIGPHIAVSEEELLGPEPGPAYRRPEGE